MPPAVALLIYMTPRQLSHTFAGFSLCIINFAGRISEAVMIGGGAQRPILRVKEQCTGAHARQNPLVLLLSLNAKNLPWRKKTQQFFTSSYVQKLDRLHHDCAKGLIYACRSAKTYCSVAAKIGMWKVFDKPRRLGAINLDYITIPMPRHLPPSL